MTFQRKDIDIYAATADRVNHTVLIGDATTPFALEIALQRFGLSQSREWMLLNVFQQLADALHDFYIPIKENGLWNITRYLNGEVSTFTKKELRRELKK